MVNDSDNDYRQRIDTLNRRLELTEKRINAAEGRAGQLCARLEHAEIERSERKPTENLHAVDLYYRAVHAFRLMSPEGNQMALQLARQVMSLDPRFAAAYGVTLRRFAAFAFATA